MFGTEKKIQDALAAFKAEKKHKALAYFQEQVKYMNGSGALAWLRGALELAQELDILTAKEIEEIDKSGCAKYEANLKAQKEEKDRLAAERKAKAAEAKAKLKAEGKL